MPNILLLHTYAQESERSRQKKTTTIQQQKAKLFDVQEFLKQKLQFWPVYLSLISWISLNMDSSRSSSRRSTTPLLPRKIVIAFDATKSRNIEEFKEIISKIRLRDDMIQEVDTIKVVGVLHKVLHPMGFHIQIGPDSFMGSHVRAIKEEVSRKVEAYVSMLHQSAQECEGEGVNIEVKIVVGTPVNKVLVQEIVRFNAKWAILDRQLRKELRFYLRHVPCKVALVCDNLSLEILRYYHIDRSTDSMKHKLLYSLSKPVSPLSSQDNDSDKSSVISSSVSSPRSSNIPMNSLLSLSTSNSKERNIFSQDKLGSNPQQEISGSQNELENKLNGSPEVMQKQRNLQNISSKTPVFCAADDIKKGFDLLEYSYSNIKTATDNFSSSNLLGEGGYGTVYKGQQKDGKLIAVKVQKKADTQVCAEFYSEIYPLSFACHTNVVKLLGYCCKENLKILIYEYICNKSLEWHLFENTEQVLEWKHRHAIAVGTAKGLLFLHEECLGSPIIHWDIRPSNILLTQDFVPLLGDWGLANWKTKQYDKQRKILGYVQYLAPESRESSISSVKTDVYALGVVLIQMISGRKAVDSRRDNYQQSITQWALPLIQTLTFHELVDPLLGESYDSYELYNMARAAYLCLQTEPEMRPTMREVLSHLEGTNDHLRHVKSNLYPMIDSNFGQI